jgi:ABC-type cobalamin/Fe3+-siderophores transport system ATPase subunit
VTHPSSKSKLKGTPPGPRVRRAAFLIAAQPEKPPMSTFNIRLIERTTHQGSADFRVDAESAAAAATIVADAHTGAQAHGTNMVTLPDGQTQVVEAEEIVARERTFLLVDDAGTEIREIPMIDAPGRPQ